jgi:TrmH family RNA methyltransferase
MSEGILGLPGFRPDRFRFVLVEPAYGGNLGSAARALKILGFRHLGIVRPRTDPLSEEARKMAMEAVDLLSEARRYETLDEALAGAVVVVGTTRREGKLRRPHYRFDELAGKLVELSSAGDVAILFGREANGLTDEELDRATHVARFLSEPRSFSYNLSQAVLLAAYELRRAAEGIAPAAAAISDPLADHETREAAFEHLERALRAAGYLEEQTAEGLMRRIRRMLGRCELTLAETKILRGIASRILWLCGRAGLLDREEPELDREEACRQRPVRLSSRHGELRE